MKEESAQYRVWCARCRRAQSACICHHVQPLHTPHQVTFLQHPREARNPVGTARMAHLGIVGSQLWTGIHFEQDERLQALLRSGQRTVVLFPGDGARDARELNREETPCQVLVIDGTWWQARKIWKGTPSLHPLPRYQLNPGAPSRYRIRREPAEHCLSTVEAVAALLTSLGASEDAAADLLRPFDAMVEKQLSHARADNRTPRMRKKPRLPKGRSPMLDLVALRDRLVIVHGEGNGWPAREGDHPAPSLLQWSARRLSNHASFHALLQTRTALAPDALMHLGLKAADLDHALPEAEFLQHWADFSTEGDVYCAWGMHGLTLLDELGALRAPYFNIHKLTNTFLFRRMGTVEQAHTALDLPVPVVEYPGRGGRRLAMLQQVVEALMGAQGV